MYRNESAEAYEMKVEINGDGKYITTHVSWSYYTFASGFYAEYSVDQCFLPESINLSDLQDTTRPLKQFLWDVSNMVDCYVIRRGQIRELEVLMASLSF